jgi:hypothetical protein
MYKEYDIVKIRTLKEKSRAFDGTEHVKRPPQIGDEGAIVHILGLKNGEAKYIVEAVNENGETIWLADFWESELE